MTTNSDSQPPARRPSAGPFVAAPFAQAMERLRAEPRHQWLALARQDQCERWRQGDRVPAEDYFAQLSELSGEIEESLILVCGEVNLREELGETPVAAEYRARFPHLADQLAIQFALNPLLEGEAPRGEADWSALQRELEAAGYRVLREIGRGATGVVYEAEQTSLHRPVAVKCVETSGSDPKRSSRLRQEAEILGLVHHPNVVQIHEVLERHGGVYLVMELVEGPSLEEKSAGRPWDAQSAAEFVAVIAGAMQAVHEVGVLHRDLKPSNILLTPAGVPKISDFGLAKLLPSDSFLTTQDSILGTPSYMSPEQASCDAKRVGPTTDVYSLGAILYELLVGRPPFLGVTVLDTLGMIRERDPIHPRQLQPTTPRDLETICLKCLEKQPEDRYPEAIALAEDLRRFLAGEAISGRRPPLPERIARSAKRHRTAYLAAILVLGSLLAGVSVATWGLYREQAARRHAEEARDSAQLASEKSDQVAGFLKEVLQSVEPSIALGQDDAMMRQVLEKAAQRIDADLVGQPEVEAELKATIGTTYFRLGDLAKAEALHRDALALRREAFGPASPVTAESMNDLGRVLINRGDPDRYEEAESLVSEALRIRRLALGDADPGTALSVYLRASLLYRRGLLPEAERLYRESLASRRLALGDDHRDVAASLINLALALRDQGKLADSEAAVREALAIQRRILPADHPDIADATLNLAGVLDRKGEYADAESLSREALRIRVKVFGREHPQVVAALSRLAGIAARSGRSAEVDPLYLEILEIEKRLYGERRPAIAVTLDNYADALVAVGRYDDAEARLRDALAIRQEALGETHPDTLSGSFKLALFLRDQKRYDEAAAMLRERLRLERTRTPLNHSRIGSSLANLTLTLLALGRFEEAEVSARDYLRVIEVEKPYQSPWFEPYAKSLLGACLLGQKDYAAAEPLLIAGYRGMTDSAEVRIAGADLRARETAERLAQLYIATEQPREAAEWQARVKTPATSPAP